MRKSKLAAGLLTVSLAASPAYAGDVWTSLIAGTVVGAIIVAANQNPDLRGRQQYQPEERITYRKVPGQPIPQAIIYTQAEPIVVNESQPIVHIANGVPQRDPRKEYLKECQRYGMSLNRCINIWDGPNVEVEEAPPQIPIVITHKAAPKAAPEEPKKLLDVENKEYKERREEALKKPNSFVEQITVQ
jgi:hypothetical protein